MLHETECQRAGPVRALPVLKCPATFTATSVAGIGSLIIVTVYPSTLLWIFAIRSARANRPPCWLHHGHRIILHLLLLRISLIVIVIRCCKRELDPVTRVIACSGAWHTAGRFGNAATSSCYLVIHRRNCFATFGISPQIVKLSFLFPSCHCFALFLPWVCFCWFVSIK